VEQPIILTTREILERNIRGITALTDVSRTVEFHPRRSQVNGTSRRCIVNEHVGRNLRSQLSSCQKIFQTDVARNFKDRPVQTNRSYTRNFRRRSFPSLLRTLISRESSPTCVDLHIALLISRAEICKNAHAISSVFYVRKYAV